MACFCLQAVWPYDRITTLFTPGLETSTCLEDFSQWSRNMDNSFFECYWKLIRRVELRSSGVLTSAVLRVIFISWKFYAIWHDSFWSRFLRIHERENWQLSYAKLYYAISVSNLCFLTSGMVRFFSVFCTTPLSPCQINIEAKACCTTL